MTWPAGFGTELRLDGHCRDAVTHATADPPLVVDEATAIVGIVDRRGGRCGN
jgi:hypothetical protein